MKFFNTAGPIVPEMHYYIPVEDRIDLDEIMMLIAQGKYFVLHAPRQSGKTTLLFTLMKMLNESGKYKCLYVNVEGAQATREDVKAVNRAIIRALETSEDFYLKDNIIGKSADKILKKDENTAIANMLVEWSQKSNCPTVLFIDEIDSLVGDGLITVLRQLRSGYDKRPSGFPQSVILCGVRDVKDYRIHSTEGKEIITGGSCFNIKAKSLTVGNFTKEDIKKLFAQHTKETGQKFTDEAIETVFYWTNGQPWLTNALAYEVCYELPEGKNRKNKVTVEMIRIAKERLIQGRITHLDQLSDKLKEERVKRVITPVLEGKEIQEFPRDDLDYCIDLGLVINNRGVIEIANRMYGEVIPRELSYMTQIGLGSVFYPEWYEKDSGKLNIEKLMLDFQEFFRENSEVWVERFDYKEAGPQLLMQAYLQRVLNGGGHIYREYGLGKYRTDLLIEWNDGTKFVIEMKILRKSMEKTLEVGLEQTHKYMDRTGTDIGHLMIFDRSGDKTWDEKIFRREEEYKGKKIIVWGM